MDFDLFKKVALEIYQHDPDTEVWATIMGEVFTKKDLIFRYISFAKNEAKLKKFNINTNLVMFDPSYIDQMEESNLNKLTVGLDAASQETYDQIRVGGNFEKVESNVWAILNEKKRGRLKNLELILQFIVQENNIHEENTFIERWKGAGATIKIRQKLGWGVGVEANNLCISEQQRKIPCPWLMRTMSVHWTGEIAQCDAEWNGDQYVGDLRQQTIEEVWLGQLLEKRKRHLVNDFDMVPCRDCKDWQCGRAELYV